MQAPFRIILQAMMPFFRTVLMFVMLLAFAGNAAASLKEDILAAVPALERDYRAFYLDGVAMGSLGAGVLGAGFLANSSADREADEFFQENIRSSTTDSFSDVARVPGDVLVAIPLLFGTYALSEEGEWKSWAGDSLRALFVGAPSGLLLQYSTGASRPEEGGSGWKPFRGNNGLSGHAFVGAVPFITAAKRQESFAMKSFFYGLSVLPGLSRVNDEKHYLSQAALGWWLAYLSVNSIEHKKELPTVCLFPLSTGVGLGLTARF